MTISKRTHEITQIAAHAAIDKIAVDVVALDLSDQLVLSEVFLIVTGQNEAQVDSIADEVERFGFCGFRVSYYTHTAVAATQTCLRPRCFF